MPALKRITLFTLLCLALVACGASENDFATLVPTAESDGANRISDESPRAEVSAPDGQIPATWTPMPTAEAPPPPPTRAPDETYVVQPGDTLAEIAEQFSVDLERLIDANGIQNMDIIGVGDVLTIPRYAPSSY